jgi:hypothetical protein
LLAHRCQESDTSSMAFPFQAGHHLWRTPSTVVRSRDTY